MNFASFLFLLLSTSLHEGCIFDVGELKPEPIVLNANYEFIYPNGTDIDAGGKIIVSCPGTGFVVFPETSTISLVCNEKDELEWEGVGVVINTSLLNCNKDIVSSIQYTNRTCWENAETIRMGFQVDSVFVPVMDVCFDVELKNALYSNYSITKYSNIDVIYDAEDHVRRNITQDDAFDSLFYPTEYIYKNGRETLNSLVGLANDSDYYYDFPNMDTVPLGGYCDLYYFTQIQAVSRFINIWPRFIIPLEEDMYYYSWEVMMILTDTYFLVPSQLDLQAYTGTFGVIALDHVFTGEKIPIYLYDHDVKAIPLPAVIWKLFYHEETKRAIVLLVVNGPYDDDYVICNDIISLLPWIRSNLDSLAYYGSSGGHIYACSYPTLDGVIPYLPKLDVDDILV